MQIKIKLFFNFFVPTGNDPENGRKARETGG